jgi:hypothetical protein
MRAAGMASQSCHKSLPALAKIVGSYFFAEDSPESERRKNTVGGLTRESTKTENFATNAYKNPDDDPSLDTVKANIHNGWYVGGTPESKT